MENVYTLHLSYFCKKGYLPGKIHIYKSHAKSREFPKWKIDGPQVRLRTSLKRTALVLSGMEEKEWYHLDTTGNLYPSVLSRRNTTIFRLAVQLKKPVHVDRLNRSLRGRYADAFPTTGCS
jgi:hypothetical protein